ncbi:hypothetical protein CLIB1444_05S04170 [[Candida] jaroonii]|uniref:Uncharacterized protein n=1 Tax=[Candida] jaroonii TaxID=467808 RepID=A0ACA9Y8V2_9ASCO|nr:hypothetical protein CLIB1444_05S04170 [[Candida] jaroonii]
MLHKSLIELFEVPQKCNTVGDLVLQNDIYQIIFESKTDKQWFLSLANDYVLLSTIDPTRDIFIDTYQNLIKFLEQLLTDTKSFPFTLNSLIIDDLSRFYFSKVDLQGLKNLLLNIKDRFKCNILIFSWDYKFDRGFRNMTHKDISELDNNISYLNLNLDFLYVYKSTIYKYFDHRYQAIEELKA